MEYIHSSKYGITFYDASGSEITNVDVSDDSYRYVELMGKDELVLKFALPSYLEFPIGSYCVFQGRTYELMTPDSITVVSRRYFEYTMTLEHSYGHLRKYKIHNMVDGRLQFDLTATPMEHLEQLVNNLNERDSGWTVGVCIEANEKLITYDHTSCVDALSVIADTFDTEFEVIGKSISLHKVEYHKDSPIELSYGKGNGFKSGVTRTNYDESLPVERLWVQGGDRNIDRSKYAVSEDGTNGSRKLLLPEAGTIMAFDGNQFYDEESAPSGDNVRKYIVDEGRLSIHRNDKPYFTKNEDSLDCTDIYPQRRGRVSKVRYVYKGQSYSYDELIAAYPAAATADWNASPFSNVLVDFYDDSIEESLDYEQCNVSGEIKTVIFQTGMLAGRELNIARYVHKDASGNAVRKFEIERADIDGVLMPSNIFRIMGSEEYGVPATGDEYIVFNCSLPQSYYVEAEKEMMRNAIKFFYEHEDLRFTFKGELDGIWAKKDWVNVGSMLVVGGYVKFSDQDIIGSDSFDVRIFSLKQYVNNPYSPVIELSNEPAIVGHGIGRAINRLDAESVHVDAVVESQRNYTKRSFRQAKETLDMLQGAVEGFTGGINPVTVQTMQMLVGDERLQFRFIRSASDIEKMDCPISWDNESKKLKSIACFIAHMTYGMENKSVSPHNAKTAEDYARWSLAAYESAELISGEMMSKAYYLYAVCSKSDTYPSTGAFVLSEDALPFESGSSLNLLVGILSSEIEGDRSFAPLYGYTEIRPGEITTDTIVSSDGSTYFNLLNNEIGGRINFRDGLISGAIGVGKDAMSMVAGINGAGGIYPMIYAGIERSRVTWYCFASYEGDYVYTMNYLPTWQDTTIKVYNYADEESELLDLWRVIDDDNIADPVTGDEYRRRPTGDVITAASVNTATFKVFEDGRLIVGTEQGKHVTIEPSVSNPSISIFNEEGERSILMTGDVYEESDLYKDEKSIVLPVPNVPYCYFPQYNEYGHLIYDAQSIGDSVYFDLDGAGTLSFSYGVTCFADDEDVHNAPVEFWLELLIDGDVVERRNGIGGVEGTGIGINVSGILVSRSLSGGRHTLSVRLRMHSRDNMTGSCIINGGTVTISSARFNYVSKLSQYFSNGFAVGYDNTNYVEAIIDANNKSLFKAVSGGAGIRVYDGSVMIMISGNWYFLKRNSDGSLLLNTTK